MSMGDSAFYFNSKGKTRKARRQVPFSERIMVLLRMNSRPVNQIVVDATKAGRRFFPARITQSQSTGRKRQS
jgi:hypothetical protein